jgi:hypothetical protein
MASWAEYGLPSLQESGYGYSINAGLSRTPFETARPRQTRLFATNQHTYNVSVQVTQAQLTTAEWFLTNFGFSWFEAALTDDQGAVFPRFVRATADYSVTVKGYDTYEIGMTLESYVVAQELSSYVTSRLYPIHFMDEMTGSHPTAPKSILEAYDRLTTHQPLAAIAPPDAPNAGAGEAYDRDLYGGPPDAPTAS